MKSAWLYRLSAEGEDLPEVNVEDLLPAGGEIAGFGLTPDNGSATGADDLFIDFGNNAPEEYSTYRLTGQFPVLTVKDADGRHIVEIVRFPSGKYVAVTG